MNEDQLRSALDAATSVVEPRSPSFGAVAAAGRRRRARQRALSGLAAVAVVAAGVVGGAALAGGSGDETSIKTVDRPDRSTTTERAVTTETTPVPPTTPTTSAPATTTTTTVPPPPARPVARPAAVGDVDGDGVRDVITIAPAASDRSLVRAQLSTLGPQEVITDLFDGGGGALAVMGVSDIDGDGFGEVFLRLGRNGPMAFGSLLRLVDDRLVLVGISRDAGEWDPSFDVGGDDRYVASLSCLTESGRLVWTQAFRDGPEVPTYKVYAYTVELEGVGVRSVSSSEEDLPPDRVPRGVMGCPGIPEQW